MIVLCIRDSISQFLNTRQNNLLDFSDTQSELLYEYPVLHIRCCSRDQLVAMTNSSLSYEKSDLLLGEKQKPLDHSIFNTGKIPVARNGFLYHCSCQAVKEKQKERKGR